MAKEAYYFPHDSNAQDDPKCMILIDQLGMEGYGIFWALIERLRNEEHYILPLNVVHSFAKRWGTSKEKIDTVIRNFGLFVIFDDIFFSERLKSSMEFKSDKAKQSANARWENKKINIDNQQVNANALQTHTDSNATDMRIDAIKEKKRKEKESKIKNNIKEEYKEENRQVVVPFESENFKQHWQEWKNYKKQQHRFTFKGLHTEQMQLKHLVSLSNGFENVAIEIINQSMANGWKGLFELKNITNGKQSSSRNSGVDFYSGQISNDLKKLG